MTADSTSLSHLTTEELAAYLDHRLDLATTSRLESHMAHCRDCRADLVDLRALLLSANGAARESRAGPVARRWQWLAAAAIIAITLLPLVPSATHSPTNAARPVRTSVSQGGIDVAAPREQSVPEPAIVFTWRAVDGASTYRLTIADSAGVPLLTRPTTDTTVTAPMTAEVQRGHAYLWYVDCLTSDGRTVSSGIHSFSISR